MRRHLVLVSIGVLTLVGSVVPASAQASGQRSVAIAQQAKAGKNPLPVGELLDRRTRHSRTTRHADGKYSTTVYVEPINYRDNSGRWQPIDSNLTSTVTAGYAFQNKANAFKVLFKKDLSTGYLRFDVAGKPFVLTAEGTAGHQGTVRGNEIAYAGAFP